VTCCRVTSDEYGFQTWTNATGVFGKLSRTGDMSGSGMGELSGDLRFYAIRCSTIYYTQNICGPELLHSEIGKVDGRGKGEQDAVRFLASPSLPVLRLAERQRVHV
jgi:hypothetical protein